MIDEARQLLQEYDEDDILVALHWYCNDYYKGQTCEKYAYLCKSPFVPSVLSHGIVDEGTEVKECYQILVENKI